MSWIAWSAGAAGVAAVCAAVERSLVRRFHEAGVVDQVGERSSHTQPTPRGGGAGFVLAATVGWMIAVVLVPGIDRVRLGGIMVAAVMIATIGFLDDLRGVSALWRLLVHLAAAALGLWSASASSLLPDAPMPQAVGFAVLVVGVAWFVNAFNFMDGTDAFAASHGLAVSALIVALLCIGGSADPTSLAIATSLGAALLGFLPWNWPKARIFMGDVGSGWMGFVVALLLVSVCSTRPAVASAGLALLAPFMMDPTVCLVRRALRGERIWQAHRSHAFQNLSRRVGSHSRLLALWWGIGLLAYLPLAVLTFNAGPWPWLPLALALGAVQALALKSGVPGVAER